MNKYIGKFRVLAPLTKKGEFTDNYDDTYIENSNGFQIYRYDNQTLALYVPTTHHSKKMAIELYPYLTPKSKLHAELDDLTGENIFYFYEKYINKVAPIIKPKTKGKDINPRSKKNLKSYTPYEIKSQELASEFSDKFKAIYEKYGKSPKIYMKGYDYINDRLILTNFVDFLQYAEKEELRPIQALDDLGLFKIAIKLLDEFEKNLK